ncbi:MAG: hypothetical protein AAFO29_05800, partial [Actinomycetota bacterium]
MASPVLAPWRRAVLVAAPLLIALVAMACAADDDPEESAEDVAPSTTATEASADDGVESDEGSTSTTAAPTTVTPSSVGAATDPVVFNDDFSVSVAPVLAEKCASCHAPGGPGTAHWVLAYVADVTENRQAIVEVIDGGLMPPWPAGGASPAFVGDRSLRDDQMQAILEWHEAGGVVDLAETDPIEPTTGVVGLADPDLTITPDAAYAGSLDTRDDYRCQIYDPKLPDG